MGNVAQFGTARTTDAIVFEGVSKLFRHRAALFNWLGSERTEPTVALRDVSFGVRSGSVTALLGPNGSGKTTLLKLISTMLLPDAGRVLVHGNDARSQPQRVRCCVGFAVASERSFFPRLTARENLDFFAAMEDVPARSRKLQIEIVLQRISLLEAADTLVMKFSAGMYQRLALARAMIKQPAVILLDEPTRSLDPGAAGSMRELIRELSADGTTVVLASHNFEEVAAVADSVVFLNRGQLVTQRTMSGVKAKELGSLYFDKTREPATTETDFLLEICP
jgi:ABC-2 type transport system ATP-binding protein